MNAEQHQRCALEIDEIQRDLRVKMPDVTEGELQTFCHRYNAVLQKYSINHEEVDFMKHQIDRPHEYPWLGRWEKAKFRVQIVYSKYFSTLMLSIITLSLIWLIFSTLIRRA